MTERAAIMLLDEPPEVHPWAEPEVIQAWIDELLARRDQPDSEPEVIDAAIATYRQWIADRD